MCHNRGVSCDYIMTDARGQLAAGISHLVQKNARRLPAAEDTQFRNAAAEVPMQGGGGSGWAVNSDHNAQPPLGLSLIHI